MTMGCNFQVKQWSGAFKEFKIGFKIKLGAKLN